MNLWCTYIRDVPSSGELFRKDVLLCISPSVGMLLLWPIFVFLLSAKSTKMQLNTSKELSSAGPASNIPSANGGDLDIPNVDVRMVPQKRSDSS